MGESSLNEELEILQGAVAAVVYQNYDNGYAVLKLNCGGGITVTVVGTIPLPVVGERLMVTGKWSNHSNFGRQFEAEFLELKNGGFLATTEQCPSKEQYNHLVQEKQKQISKLFEKVLTAEYIEVDYKEEKERANAAYLEYKKAKAWTNRNILGDIIFLLLAIASVIVPYWTLQLTSYAANTTASIILALSTAGLFGGLFVCSIIFQLIPMMHKLNKAKTKLYNCYLDCCAKERYSFSSLRRRYERDLIAIEQTRYELRQLKQLFDENLEKEKNVLAHRKMLDDMSDCLSSMLNNLDVEPVFDPNESVDGEFDLCKSLYSRENKVYQIFSMETIEKIFAKKGSDEK